MTFNFAGWFDYSSRRFSLSCAKCLQSLGPSHSHSHFRLLHSLTSNIRDSVWSVLMWNCFLASLLPGLCCIWHSWISSSLGQGTLRIMKMRLGQKDGKDWLAGCVEEGPLGRLSRYGLTTKNSSAIAGGSYCKMAWLLAMISEAVSFFFNLDKPSSKIPFLFLWWRSLFSVQHFHILSGAQPWRASSCCFLVELCISFVCSRFQTFLYSRSFLNIERISLHFSPLKMYEQKFAEILA